MRILSLLLIFTAFLFSCSEEEPLFHPHTSMDLDNGWTFHEVGKTDTFLAVVPGTVMSDLAAQAKIMDPWAPGAEDSLAWIGQREWEYVTHVEVTDEMRQHVGHYLTLEGLDTYAKVYWDDELVLEADNMYRQWEVDLTGKVTGSHELRIVFESVYEKHKEEARNSLYSATAGNDADSIRVNPYVRKAPYHFGWDWAPRLLTPGIHRPVSLTGWTGARIDEVNISQRELPDGKFEVEVEVMAYANKSGKYYIESEIANALNDITDFQPNNSITGENLSADRKVITQRFVISNPMKWSPNGYGKQPLYDLKVKLAQEQHTLAEDIFKLGLRTIELVQEPDTIGTSFYFKVNGRPIFAKGANYVPMDVFLPNNSCADKARLLEDAKAAGFNMIRVWGGGIYEDDCFYQKCDELGLLVWQDFMFAGTMYPLDSTFVDDMKSEVYDVVHRLKHHACIALWCGNNEIDVAWHNWGWQDGYDIHGADSAKMWDEYVNFFQQELPYWVEVYADGAAYVSTSPLSNWGTPENFNHSSMHYWGVWHGADDFEDFRNNVPRFMVEYGFQSLPGRTTMRQFSGESDKLTDPSLADRQKSYKGYAELTRHMKQHFPVPENLDDYALVSQWNQAYAMELAIDAHRKASLHCDGTLYWQLNDCWPGPSWSTIDYNGEWKAAHYQVRRSYANILPRIEWDNEHLKDWIATWVHIWIDMDTFCQEGTHSFSLIDWEGNVELSHEYTYPSSSESAFAFATLGVPADFDLSTGILLFQWKDNDGKMLSERIFWPKKPRETLLLDAPPVIDNLKEVPEGYQFTISASAPLRYVSISTQSMGMRFSDNYFDMYPGQTKTITLECPHTNDPEQLYRQLKIKTLADYLN